MPHRPGIEGWLVREQVTMRVLVVAVGTAIVMAAIGVAPILRRLLLDMHV